MLLLFTADAKVIFFNFLHLEDPVAYMQTLQMSVSEKKTCYHVYINQQGISLKLHSL